jgi:uncharacterized OB-fold protein
MSNEYYEKINLNIGWECPKCGAVMAPHMNVCINCTGDKTLNVASTTNTVKLSDFQYQCEQEKYTQNLY